MSLGTGPIIGISLGLSVLVLLVALLGMRLLWPDTWFNVLRVLHLRTSHRGDSSTEHPPTPPPNSMTTVSPERPRQTALSGSPSCGRGRGRHVSPPPHVQPSTLQRRSQILHLLTVAGRAVGQPEHPARQSAEGEAERGRVGWHETGGREEVSPVRSDGLSSVLDGEETPRPPFVSDPDDSVQSLGRPSTTNATRRSHDAE